MKDNDMFSQLWRQQQTSEVDVGRLKKQWRKVQFKQWLYFTLDLLATLILPIALVLMYPTLSVFEIAWFTILGTLCVGFFAYLVWLRRYSLGFGKDRLALNNYLDLVKAQYRQNIKIARLSKLSTYIMPLILMGFLLGAYLAQIIEMDLLIRKIKFTSVFLAISMPGIWVWAHKREQKFARALESIEQTYAV